MANHLCVTRTIRAPALFPEGHQTGPYPEVTYSLLLQRREFCGFRFIHGFYASILIFDAKNSKGKFSA